MSDMEWIEVGHDLPMRDFEVLVCCDDDVELSVFREYEDGSYSFDGMVKVTHWMYKPEPAEY